MQTAELKAALEALLVRSLSYQELELVVRSFHGLATAYIGRKMNAGRLETSRLGVSLEDLAVDCIAELFARDEEGRFDILQSYFGRGDLERMSEGEFLGLCRRLVFSAVNQQLFRIYGAYDPAFRKLLRNLKGAAHRTEGFHLVEHQGDSWVLISSNGAQLNHTPAIPPEYLEVLLTRQISVRDSSVDMLRAFDRALSDTQGYAHGYPLIGLAAVLRHVLARMEMAEAPEPADAISVEEIDRVITSILPQVITEVGERYVREGKLDQEVLGAYRLAVREILLMEYGHGNGQGVSFYDILSTLLPGTTPTEYAAIHRSRLEYVVRLCRRRFLEAMQDNL